MLALLKINDQTAQNYSRRFSKAIDKLNDHYQEKTFLAGDSFSRADLTAAALLASLYMPDQYGLN